MTATQVTRVRGGYRVEGHSKTYKTERGARSAVARIDAAQPASGAKQRIVDSTSDEGVAALRQNPSANRSFPGVPPR